MSLKKLSHSRCTWISNWGAFLIPLLLCVYGLYFTFHHFWHGLDAISGDLGDARFNALVLEHLWLWLTGVHASLFNTPMFYPHENVYAYSDYLLAVSPFYFVFRFLGMDMLLSFQAWLVFCCVLNFLSFYLLLKKFMNFNTALSAVGAYVFSFSLPRITHLEHAQLIPEFFIVISAMGALTWWKTPASRWGPFFFLVGAALQMLTAFYFFWFWIWSLCMLGFFVGKNQFRKAVFLQWLKKINFKFLFFLFFSVFLLLLPFLYHYLKVAHELGMRGWVVISNSVPRFYSWFNFPKDHWEWPFIPFKGFILSLPVVHEHYLSFGLLTWASMGMALFWVYRQQSLRYLTVPIFSMFLFTLTSGRFSSWVLITYLFPGGGVIRAVGRIQIFMLFFWALIFVSLLKSWFSSSNRLKVALAFFMVVIFFAENTYQSDWVFSRASENNKIHDLAERLPPDCECIFYENGFHLYADFENNDAVMLAFLTHRKTINGYSGNQPPFFDKVFFSPSKSLEDKIREWFQLHQVAIPKKTCKLSVPVL